MSRLLITLLCILLPFAATAAEQSAVSREVESLVTQSEDLVARDKRAEANALLEQARELVKRQPDLDAELQLRSADCWLAFDEKPATEVEQLAEAAYAYASERRRPRWVADFQLCRGYAREMQGRLDEAVQDYQVAVNEGRRLQAPKLLADATWTRGELRSYRGEFADALSDLKESYALYRDLNHPTYARDVLRAIATLYSRLGEHDQALHYLKQLRALAEAEGLIGLAGAMEGDIGHAFSRKGDHANALEHYQRALALAETREQPEQIALMQQSIGAELVGLNRAQEALAPLQAALKAYETVNDPIQKALTHYSRGEAYLQLGRSREAIAEFDIAIPVFEAQQTLRYLAEARLARANALAQQNQWQAAYKTLSEHLAEHSKLDQQLREEQTTRSRVQFDTEKKEQENASLEKEKALTTQALADAERIRALQSVVIALSVVLLIIIGYLGWRQLKASRRMRDLALTDELTRLPNRRHILSYATEQIEHARGHNSALSVLVCDIDYFKRVNDTYGHAVGDVVLQRIAHACQHVLRAEDKLGRTGGEEFLVVLPGATGSIAMDVAERLRQAVDQIDCRDLHADLHINISIGACEWTTKIPDIAQLSRHADDALYRAKANGRNCAELAMPAL